MSRAQAAFALAASKPWLSTIEEQTLRLPFPPSLNTMYFNNIYGNGGRGRGTTKLYEKWQREAGNEMKLQHARRVAGPVEITMTFEDKKGRRDLDNLAKPVNDLLVKMGVIDGDHSGIVRRITLSWGSCTGCRVEIRKIGAACGFE